MSVPANEEPNEFVVSAELAEVAERQGVPLHAGERVRFEVIEGGRDDDSDPPAPDLFGWIGSIKDADPHLAENARTVLRAEFSQQ